jgi:GNAT superfamily N-acetyltransferase
VVRPYRPAEYPALVVVINSVCAEGLWLTTPHFQPDTYWQAALTLPARPDHLLLVAAYGEEVVGWCRLWPLSKADLELGIGLLAPWRNQGYGRRLVQSALTWAGHTTHRRVMLQTRHTNHRARHLFTTCGFVVESGDETYVTMVYHLQGKYSYERVQQHQRPTTAVLEPIRRGN